MTIKNSNLNLILKKFVKNEFKTLCWMLTDINLNAEDSSEQIKKQLGKNQKLLLKNLFLKTSWRIQS